MLRRGLELEGLPLASDSSGGSDKGLEVAVKGLPGGLVSPAGVTAFERDCPEV